MYVYPNNSPNDGFTGKFTNPKGSKGSARMATTASTCQRCDRSKAASAVL